MLKKHFPLLLLCFTSFFVYANTDKLTHDQISDQRWSAFSDVAELYLKNANANEFISMGDHEKDKWGNYPGALSYYFMALNKNKKSIMAAYQVGAALAYLEINDEAIKYLNIAYQNGLWQYYLMKEDDELSLIRKTNAYQTLLEKVKVRYQSHVTDAGKAKIFAPSDHPPKAGWPVVVWLSGYGTEGTDSQSLADAFTEVHAIFIGINGTEKLNDHSFRWSNNDTTSTNDAVIAALKQAETQYPVNKNKVVLMGFSQGALHTAHLLADHPNLYSGALIISAGGWQKNMQKSTVNKKNIIISYGKQEAESNRSLDQNLIHYFSLHNNVEVHTHNGAHFFDNSWEQAYPNYLIKIIND
ncbi:alpha/beta hydrolase [Photobacterium kishitanii]|uniref:alpha/beta hydrolase n=1 Tax=Photobacterium kishitanii TaxID=318456 RepID=UPI000D16F9CA|nr:alpha/beta hydrolase-fold protein [Photobacterium kishitanii]PSV09562.1 hypothetical protein C0W28_20170 [Photobacterium kishitanii]